MQISKRGWLCVPDMAISLQPCGGAAAKQDRKIRVVVNVGIPNAASVEQKRIVEQRPRGVRRRS